MLGGILLILLADVTHFEDLMEQVEWTTLVFFSGLFILMKVSLNSYWVENAFEQPQDLGKTFCKLLLTKF